MTGHFYTGGGSGGGGGGGAREGGGAIDERYVTLGGCTAQRYEALQGGGGGGGSSFPEKKRYVTLEWPPTGKHKREETNCIDNTHSIIYVKREVHIRNGANANVCR